ncbi:putative FAD dependent oxidoreductase [Exophiala viscosa]|uniref:FAD dependent oxidoreductase n=1 Tax=Exophiala viscosa TaxID=2486360 RepID=A0AAN6IAL2_9EURO|nr:putative FAD dependent oxidoreductase [Exophiala viscosa]
MVPEIEDVEVPVLVVGAGPSGATLALLLGRHGIPVVAISRHKGTANTPRAHIFNQRAMEVLRDAGIEHLVKPIASTKDEIAHVAWLHTLAGEEYGRVYAWGNKPNLIGEYLAASPCEMSDLPQSVLEPILVEEARKLGADIRFSTEFLSHKRRSDGHIVTRVRNRVTSEEYNIISQYLVGADGARSAVLASLDIPIDGKQLDNAFNVYIRADLSRYFAIRPASMVWILNPDAPAWSSHGSIRMVRPWSEFIVSMHNAQGNLNFEPNDEDILKRLRQMIGDDSIDIDLLGHFRWTINDQVARTWQRDNVLCIGDAVHRHPPINGLGSNTCISDAFNLAWKLAHVLKGWAAPSILDSLTAERKPVGDGIVRRANDGMLVHRRLWAFMGSTVAERAVVSQALQSATSDGMRTRMKLRSIIEETDDEFNSLGIQMNQTYVDSPLTVVEQGDRPPDLEGLNVMKKQIVSTFPGFHLPHVWLVRDGQTARISTLDLAGHGSFVAFTGIGGEGWIDAASELTSEGKVTVKAYGIGRGLDFLDAYWDWEKVRAVEEDGLVLVRPDHFVCWRCSQSCPNPSGKLREVMRRILGQ